MPADGRRRGYGGRLPPAGTSALLLAVENAHFELAARPARRRRRPERRRCRATRRCTRSPGSASRAAATTIRAPDGSGNMTSLELVKKLVAHGANVNARMTKKVNLGLTRV